MTDHALEEARRLAAADPPGSVGRVLLEALAEAEAAAIRPECSICGLGHGSVCGLCHLSELERARASQRDATAEAELARLREVMEVAKALYGAASKSLDWFRREDNLGPGGCSQDHDECNSVRTEWNPGDPVPECDCPVPSLRAGIVSFDLLRESERGRA